MFSGRESICCIKTAEMGPSAEDVGGGGTLRDKSNSHKRLNPTVKGGRGRSLGMYAILVNISHISIMRYHKLPQFSGHPLFYAVR